MIIFTPQPLRSMVRHREVEVSSAFKKCLLLSLMIIGFMLMLTACVMEQNLELTKNREKWEEKHITDYQYNISIISIWGANDLMPMSVFVKDGEPVLILDKDGNNLTSEWKDLASFEAMFEEIETALPLKSRKVEVAYNEIYGIPIDLIVSYNLTSVGGEYDRHYLIRDFEVLSDP